jgi:deoxyribodipyrimidine photo-lyase
VPDTVLWLRRDLRLADLPSLGSAHAAADGGAVLPLFGGCGTGPGRPVAPG